MCSQGQKARATLAELFDGRSQLMVYHFMLGPGWAEGCKSCSFLADHFDGSIVHLAHRDVTLVAASRAPFAESKSSRSAWAGGSPGFRRTAATSISITMYRSTKTSG